MYAERKNNGFALTHQRERSSSLWRAHKRQSLIYNENGNGNHAPKNKTNVKRKRKGEKKNKQRHLSSLRSTAAAAAANRVDGRSGDVMMVVWLNSHRGSFWRHGVARVSAQGGSSAGMKNMAAAKMKKEKAAAKRSAAWRKSEK